MDENKSEIGEELRAYFASQRINQTQIAERLGVTKATVSALLTGKRSFGRKTAIEWNKAFGIRVNYLLFGEGQMIDKLNTDQFPEVPPEEAPSVLGGSAPAYSIDRILEIMDRNSRTMLSQQQTIAELMSELKKRM